MLEQQFNNFIQESGIDFDLTAEILRKNPNVIKSPTSFDSAKKSFYRLITSSIGEFPDNDKYVKNIWNKLKTSGLLDLALSTSSIAEFARKRFDVGKDLVSGNKGSAAYALDPVRDTMWLTDLGNALTTLTRDPITLAIIQQYFPNLTTLFFNATAIAADYNPATGSQDDPINNPDELAKSLLRAFGSDPKTGKPLFKAAWDLTNTGQRIKAALEQFPFRENISPKSPDIFHLRLGAANFYVPPVSINISSNFKTGSLTGGAIRQKSSPKFNAGYKETSINIKLFFPNYEEIWGISIEGVEEVRLTKDFKIDFKTGSDTTEEQIDKFLSSLRGLIAAFKYAPILPIKNQYLNTVHGITGVALSSMSISTIPNYPFALVVDLELLNFNHKPFLPMIKDFNQAVHWGKFRHYMGKAAGALHSYVNESFYIESSTDTNSAPRALPAAGGGIPADRYQEDIFNYVQGAQTPALRVSNSPSADEWGVGNQDLLRNPFENDIYTTNIIKEWRNGNNISLFIPAQTQTKIFTPDTASFRSPEEKGLDDLGESFWDAQLRAIGIDKTQASHYHRSLSSVTETAATGGLPPSARKVVLQSIDLIIAGSNRKDYNKKLYDYQVTSFILENKELLKQQEIDYMRTYPPQAVAGNFTSRAIVYSYKNKDLVRHPNNQDPINYNLAEIRELFKASASSTSAYLDQLALQEAQRKADSTGRSIEDFLQQSKEDIGKSFNVLFYNRFFKSGPIQSIMEQYRLNAARRNNDGGMFGNGLPTFNEWEVPMIKVDLDPKSVIVNGVSVSLGNNLAKMQLQMQEEPTYQHIGGKDSYINISMTVFGEKELIKIRKVFEHINGLARLEHATGVIGFMGIKNIIAGLAGIKYVVPLNYEVSTIPNYPHVYDVRMSLVDFDIFQQQREKLSSKQQQDMVDVFGTKKNPFLRIKQLWGSFNAYPDFPLTIKNDLGETVGCLDPDYYFRSFEMFDQDIINNVTIQTEKTKDFVIAPKVYSTSQSQQATTDRTIMDAIKQYVQNNQIQELKDYFSNQGIGARESIAYVEGAITHFAMTGKKSFLTTFIHEYPEVDGSIAIFGSEYAVGSNSTALELKAGNIISSDAAKVKEMEAYLSGEAGATGKDGYIAFDPDELSIHHIVTLIPAQENPKDDNVPAIFTTAQGYHLGYMNKKDNKFYLTVDGMEVKPKESGTGFDYKPIPVPHTDVDNPANAYSPNDKTHSGVPGSTLANHGNPYSTGSTDTPETMPTQAHVPSTTKHWEKMLIDTQYRDISGRMVRAFPTYMLWLIDEGGYFAGVKLFDNFYGLQSIIDFSIVQSEDILGDTLVLRVSNLYSKLTTPESGSLFEQPDNVDMPTLTDGLEGALDAILNRARNMQNHMDSTYVVNINNIRLKPGVRVHLRAGYGSNPNSLQTVFNGTITQVENGEVVTITAQSDAIELSPIVNSTSKKGDSGKIDGGINTGLWLSEPRDLMVRLLSMGTSRTREAIAHATRGTIFSENKFGIRHFGSILYQPLNDIEQAKNDAMIASIKGAFDAIGENPGKIATNLLKGVGATVAGATAGGIISGGAGILAGGAGGAYAFGPEIRSQSMDLMRTLWANFSSQRDFEIFKRNIYPGNGTGIAQFLGGDLGDGWSTIASLTPEETPNERINYIGRVTDYSWNQFTEQYGQGRTDAKSVMDAYNVGKELGNRNRSASITSGLISGGLIVGGLTVATGLGAPIIGGIVGGIGLTGVLSGRSGGNIFNALGITSGMDDDIPGLDEVSFRAQTYMKSVWDLFQTCARLLPNYIVAVRPFEDRSTVFYGKPHWLYTSGVVPITAGFDSDQRAQDKGIDYPKMVDIDATTQAMLDSVNKQSNPFADAAAFKTSNNTLANIEDLLSDQRSSFIQGADTGNLQSSIYAPGNALKGKVIAFGLESSMQYKENGTITSKLPSSIGYATVGYHLPITKNGTDLNKQLDSDTIANHRQLDVLPYRYRFPFFTDRDDNIGLEDYAYYALSEDLGKWNNHKADYVTLAIDDWSYGSVGNNKNETEWIKLLKLEKELFTGINTVDTAFTRNANEVKIGLKLNISGMVKFSDTNETGAEEYIYSDKNKQTGSNLIVRMPYPDRKSILPNGGVNGAEEYKLSSQTPITEWGSPTDAVAEQFYIAMRWPFNPKDDVENFKSIHSITETYGKSEDYKKRRVLVYSPTTGQAVVCQPAYFLWGKETVNRLKANTNFSDESKNISRGLDEFGNNYENYTDGARHNDLALGEDIPLDAIVSPDAAYFLGMLNLTLKESEFWGSGNHSKSEGSWHDAESAITAAANAGIAPFPVPRQCLYAFVPDSTPLGVVPDLYLPTQEFDNPPTGYTNANIKKIIGFGKFSGKASIKNPESDSFYELTTAKDNTLVDANEVTGVAKLGGNIISSDITNPNGYFDLVKAKSFDKLTRDSLYNILDNELSTTNSGTGKSALGRKQFIGVYTETDQVSINARKYYDEDYDQYTNVIAGDGRTLQEASDIWDQFRFGYHTYTNVKEAFQNAYGLDPDSEEDLYSLGSLGAALGIEKTLNAANGRDLFGGTEESYKNDIDNAVARTGTTNSSVFSKYGSSAEDEFTTVFGSDFFDTQALPQSDVTRGLRGINGDNVKAAVEASRKSFIDADEENDGLIEYYNKLVDKKVESIKSLISDGLMLTYNDEGIVNSYLQEIKTSKQLFLFIVGAFRNAMWNDEYARAWLVLKPNRKMRGTDQWDFNPVLKIFQAFIDPNSDFAKKPDKFKKLLAENRGEGSSATNIVGKATQEIDGFWDSNIGPLFTALGDSLSGLINLFRMSMTQLGYGLGQVGKMSKQANILNKALNDSIYYSLGRPGTLLRAVDNPFTREYGEPVVEIREPFQRMHYISSFSHIISNGIQENISGVATSVTAVSDGKYPVNVAMDKSTPSERQVEKTVETGIYYDNATGSGLFGALQPVLHPFEFARGISKLAQGTPDELLAKRIALSHLKESLKDIYGGEIVVIGNADIRPHDIVYIADVYERMYGMFEVEQVVHHFTSELGFITSITPNALVTVNDPSRWFMSSWMGSWFHMQSLRNDTRLYMNSLGSGITASGSISVDGLSDSLNAQMVGGIQYTHGAAALAKDAMATFASEGFADINAQVKDMVKNNGGAGIKGGIGLAFAGATALGATAAGIASLAIPGAGALAITGASLLGSHLGGSLAWKGWSWIRDNVLDQHGCYIQYLNKNGQAMDAGLNQSGQGMVVGRYHTKKLLPGILGVSEKVRTAEGNSYIRTDDLLKNLGWREKEINDLTRYVSLENAIVNAQVLKYAGIGPEKAGLNRFFKTICRVTKVIDGDTIDVVDIFDSSKIPFRIRFDGINTPELNIIKSDTANSAKKTFNINYIKIQDNKMILGLIPNPPLLLGEKLDNRIYQDDISVISIPSLNISRSARVQKINTQDPDTKEIINEIVLETTSSNLAKQNVSGTVSIYGYENGEFAFNTSPGGKSAMFTQNAVRDKIIILRMSPTKKQATSLLTEADFEADSEKNKVNQKFYSLDVYGRTLGTIFYRTSSSIIESLSLEINNIFINNKTASINLLKNYPISNSAKDNGLGKVLYNSFYNEIFKIRFSTIYNSIIESKMNEKQGDYFSKFTKNNSNFSSYTQEQKTIYNTYFNMRILQDIYDKVSDWPNIEWDDYYDDGTAASLNWELVTNNLAKVDTVGLLIEQPSVITSGERLALPTSTGMSR